MDGAVSIKLDTPAVASQVIDGEAIIIHFETGCYYSSDKLGGEIIGLLEEECTLSQLTEQLAQIRQCEPKALSRTVSQFVDELVREELVVLSESSGTPGSNGQEANVLQENMPVSAEPVEVPVLHKYTELEDLLLLDPIHDIDAAGWPLAKAD